MRVDGGRTGLPGARVGRVALLAVAACFYAGCGQSRDADERSHLDLLLSDGHQSDAIRATVLEKEQGFLQATSKPGPAVADYFDLYVWSYDVDASKQGKPAFIQFPRSEYFATIARLSGANLVADSIRVLLAGNDRAYAIAFPQHNKPVITTWELHQKEWCVTSIVLNADEKSVELYGAQR